MKRPILKTCCLALAALALAGCPVTDDDPSVPRPVALACNEVSQILEKMPFDHVRRGHGPVADPHTARERPGCTVTANGSRQRLSVLERTDATRPDARVRELLPPRGWTEDPRYAADGPDGARFAFRSTRAICYFSARWNGDDDVDAGALPAGGYEIGAACTGLEP